MSGTKSTEKTRKWAKGVNTVVLIPFPAANSGEHLSSTRGENMSAKSRSLSDMVAQMGWGPKSSTSADTSKDVWTGGWSAVGKGKINPNEDVVCKDSAGLGAALAKLKGADDVLYIRGHGNKGSNLLESSDHTQTLDVAGLIQLLNGKLDKNFPGIIKVYACHSATASSATFFGMFALYTWQPFTQQFADAMFAAGWHACRFFGYGAKVSTQSWREKANVRLDDADSMETGGGSKFAVLESGSITRASQARYEFHPAGKAGQVLHV